MFRVTRQAIAFSVATALLASGCLLAAAGAGAGGAIYLSDRGAESVVPTAVDRTFDAARQAFRELGVTERRTVSAEEGTSERRELEGTAGDRDVKVTVKTEGEGTHVEVVARRSAVTWDKDFARALLERIVRLAGE